MKQYFKYIHIILFFACLQACAKRNETISKTMILQDFEILDLRSVFDVYLIQSNENSLRIEGEARTIEKIDLIYDNQTLTIKNNMKLKWLSPQGSKVKLYLSTKHLKRINAIVTSYIKTLNAWKGQELGITMGSKLNEADLELDCDVFYYWNSFPCGGKLNLRGRTDALKIWNTALVNVDALALNPNYVLVFNSAKTDCYVRCKEKFEYRITGSGNIYLSGNPSTVIDSVSTGKGQLIIK
jgi:hypothetical protein